MRPRNNATVPFTPAHGASRTPVREVRRKRFCCGLERLRDGNPTGETFYMDRMDTRFSYIMGTDPSAVFRLTGDRFAAAEDVEFTYADPEQAAGSVGPYEVNVKCCGDDGDDFMPEDCDFPEERSQGIFLMDDDGQIIRPVRSLTLTEGTRFAVGETEFLFRGKVDLQQEAGAPAENAKAKEQIVDRMLRGSAPAASAAKTKDEILSRMLRGNRPGFARIDLLSDIEIS